MNTSRGTFDERLAGLSAQELLEAHRLLDSKESLSPAELTVKVELAEELESRFELSRELDNICGSGRYELDAGWSYNDWLRLALQAKGVEVK